MRSLGFLVLVELTKQTESMCVGVLNVSVNYQNHGVMVSLK